LRKKRASFLRVHDDVTLD